LEAREVMAERAVAVVILAMDVVGDGASERHELRSGRDRQEEAAREREFDDLRKQHAGFAGEHAAFRVERDEAVEVARAYQRVAVVQAAIAVAASRAVGEDRL